MGLNLPLPNQAILPLMIPRGGGRGIRGCHLNAGRRGGHEATSPWHQGGRQPRNKIKLTAANPYFPEFGKAKGVPCQPAISPGPRGEGRPLPLKESTPVPVWGLRANP